MSKLYYYKLGHYSLHQLNGGEYVVTFMHNTPHFDAPLSFMLNDTEIVRDNRVKEADEIFFNLITYLRVNQDAELARKIFPAVCSLFSPSLKNGDEITDYCVGIENWRKNQNDS